MNSTDPLDILAELYDPEDGSLGPRCDSCGKLMLLRSGILRASLGGPTITCHQCFHKEPSHNPDYDRELSREWKPL